MDWASDLHTFLRQMFPTPLPESTTPAVEEDYTAWVPTKDGEEPPF